MRLTEPKDPNGYAIFERVARIVESARAPDESSACTATIHANPLVDREIVQLELDGKERVG